MKGEKNNMRRAQDSLIDRHIHQWEKDKELKEKKHTPQKYSPIITISRQIGTGGVEIGELTAKALDYQLLDRTLVESIAKQAKTRQSAVETIDERSYGIVEESLRAVFTSDDLSKTKYIKHLTEVLVVAAQHGKAVIMGRGANFLLKAFLILRVRIICPLKIRIERFADKSHISLKESENLIKKSDTDRAAFIKSFFHADINDAKHYDLVINTEKMEPQHAADIITRTFKAAFLK